MTLTIPRPRPVNTVTGRMTGKITTVRLPMETRHKLETLARVNRMTMSEAIIEAIEFHYDKEEKELDSYTLGLPYFGKYGSGIGDLSTTYKQRFYDYVKEKHYRQTGQAEKLRER